MEWFSHYIGRGSKILEELSPEGPGSRRDGDADDAEVMADTWECFDNPPWHLSECFVWHRLLLNMRRTDGDGPSSDWGR